jgi:THAP domain
VKTNPDFYYYVLTNWCSLFPDFNTIIFKNILEMSCVAPGCKSGYGSDCKLPPGVTKHIFPKEEAARRAWIEAMPRDDWEPSNSSILCSLHFTDDDFQVKIF